MKADTDLMRDISRAGTELERRLTEAVRAQDGVVIIRNPIIGKFFSQVLPPYSPWVLTCGLAGISIVFGASVTGQGGSTSNDVEIDLAGKFTSFFFPCEFWSKIFLVLRFGMLDAVCEFHKIDS